VKVRASFEPVTGQKLFNDDFGPYVTATDIKVHITGDVGDFVFEIPHHSGRTVLVHFPQASAGGEDLPDTGGLYPAEDDPVDYFVFRTYNADWANANTRLNLLTMTPDVPQTVRLWNWLCTASTHGYHIKYNNPDLYHDGGPVEIVASDTDSDGKLDHWELTPLPGTGDVAWITRIDRKVKIDFGGWPMPFKLILDRL